MTIKIQFDTWDKEEKCKQLQKRFGDYDEFQLKKGNRENKIPIFDLINRLQSKYNGQLEVLEVGCGPGHFLWSFKELSTKILGLDYSSHMIKLAKTQLDKYDISTEFVQGSCWDLPFDDNYVDLSFQVDVCMHVGGSWKSIQEMIRVSRKYVVFTGPSFEDMPMMDRHIRGKSFAVSIPLLTEELEKMKDNGEIKRFQFLDRPKTKTYDHRILFIEV